MAREYSYPSSSEGLRGIHSTVNPDPLPIVLKAENDDDDIVELCPGLCMPRYATYLSPEVYQKVVWPLLGVKDAKVVCINSPPEEEKKHEQHDTPVACDVQGVVPDDRARATSVLCTACGLEGCNGECPAAERLRREEGNDSRSFLVRLY